MFKIGEKVRVIDDNQNGTVIRIHKNRITIENDFGFEETYNVFELIPDKNMEVGRVVIKNEEIQKKTEKTKETDLAREIDLHIGQLVDSYVNMTNYEMLQIQLDKAKTEMDQAIMQRRKKLVFIHGHGSGKLKSELMKLLKKYEGIEIYDASFQKFNGGATAVEFRYFS